MAVVTVSRQLGSGGTWIACELAKRLGWRYVDKEMIVAEACSEPVDELPPQQLERLGGDLARRLMSLRILPRRDDAFILSQRAALASVDDIREAPLVDVINACILALGKLGEVVIVGRGAEILLQEEITDEGQLLKVKVVAPVASRVRHLQSTAGLQADVALDTLERSDAQRSEFARLLFDVDWMDPVLYDLVINTGKIQPEAAVGLIASSLGVTGKG